MAIAVTDCYIRFSTDVLTCCLKGRRVFTMYLGRKCAGCGLVFNREIFRFFSIDYSVLENYNVSRC